MYKHELKKSELSKYLREKGLNPSFQRLKILEYMIREKSHPSAELLYKKISKELPVLSKTTIYNTLAAFIQKGIIAALNIEGNEVRYDANIKHHPHLKCVRCGKIYDLDLTCPVSRHNMIDGHKILECSIYLKGICRACLK